MKLDTGTFSDIVKNTPLVSIDLVVKNADNLVLTGLRINNPAKAFWFMPGGRIFKNQSLDQAFRRITLDELGLELGRGDFGFLGIYEHFYDSNFTDNGEFGTHYVVLAHEICLGREIVLDPPKVQHKQYQWLAPEVLLSRDDVHPYSKAYFL